jgi:tRNA-dihydrouridine synthase 2
MPSLTFSLAGCPKPFSTHSGMGAALLSTPDLLCSILRALVAALDVPVSCKIRLLPDQAETLALVEQICQTGIQCLTIHARTRSMRSTERALMERLRDCVDVATKYGIPVVANGDVGGMWDFAKVKAITGASWSAWSSERH